MDYIYDIKNLTYKYPLSNKIALKDVSIQIEKGKMHGIIGGNNSGKSTFCLALKGYIPNFYKGDLSGDIYFINNSKSENITDNMGKIGFVFSNPFSQLSGIKNTVFEEIAFGLENKGIPAETIQEKVNDVLKLTNLEKYALRNPFNLSGGQQQRLSIASILVLEPSVLILDEPTSQLDPKEAKNIYNILKNYRNRGNTVIISEQNTNLITEYCDEIILFDNGECIGQGTPENIFYSPEINFKNIELPVAVSLIQKLRENNIHISENVVKISDLSKILKEMLNHE